MSATPAAGNTADEVPLQTAAAWQQGEDRLYQSAMSRPDIYQRSMELVRRTVEHLRGLGPSTGALLAAGAQGGALVTAVVQERPMSTAELDLALVSDAALAMRHREVAAEQAALRRVRAIWAARSRGKSWVVLEVSGDSAGDPFLPYHRLEVEVGTGRALLVTATPDPDFAGCAHAVEALHVDLDNGAVSEPRDTSVAPTSHPNATTREQHAAAVRDRLSAS